MLNQQTYKMAAGGAGLIAFSRIDERQIQVLLSERAQSVGKGLGITGGGFVECDDVYNSPVGTIVPLTHEAYREGVEENPGFEKVLSLRGFDRRSQYLTSFAVRTDDANGVHIVCYFGLELSDAEFEAVSDLPPSDERVGALVATDLNWTPESLQADTPQAQINMAGMDRFYHQHELHSFVALAKLLERGISEG